MSDLVCIKNFNTRIDAELIKGLLETNGINSFISSDDMGGVGPHIAASGVKLMVAPEDAEKAKEMLRDSEV